MSKCIHCGAPTDDQTAPGCAKCNRLRSLPEDWTAKADLGTLIHEQAEKWAGHD